MRTWMACAALYLVCAAAGCKESSQRGSIDGSGSADLPLPTDGSGADGPRADGRRADGQVLDHARSPADTGGAVYDGKPGEFALLAAGRSYRLLVPSGYSAAKQIALLVGFHGAGDSGSNFYQLAKGVGFAAAAAPDNFILLVPDTKSPYKDFAVWSGNPNNDLGPMKTEMDEIVAIIKETSTHYRVDPRRVFALGFSDGGLFTAVGGMYRADVFASLTVCGFGWGGSYALVTPARKLAVQFVCGSADSFYSAAQQSEAFLKSGGHPTRLLTATSVGHSFSGLMQQHAPAALVGWMAQNPLP